MKVSRGGTPPRSPAEAREIDFGVLPGLVGYQIRLAQIAIFRDFAQDLDEQGITPGLFGVLVIVEANSGMKQSELARATHLDRSTVVNVVDNLEARGLIRREQDPTDRRSNSLRLTAEGGSLLRRLKTLVGRHEKRLVRNLSGDEQAELVRLLQKILPEHR